MKKIIYLVEIIVIVWLFLFVPSMGENAFVYYGVSAYIFVIMGIIPLVGIYISIVNRKKIDNDEELSYDDRKEKRESYLSDKEIIGCVVYGALILFIGMAKVIEFNKDLGHEPLHVVMTGCTVSEHKSFSARGGGSKSYRLQGKCNGEILSFNLSGISKAERENLARVSGPMEIVYYPNTKVIVSCIYNVDQTKDVQYKTLTKTDFLAESVTQSKEKAENVNSNQSRERENGDALTTLISKSNIPFELLSEASAPENYSNENRKCAETEDGYAFAYCSHYPAGSAGYVITKVVITGGDYNIYGYSVGDTYDNDMAFSLLNDRYEIKYVSREKDYYPAPEGCMEQIETCGNVNLFIYYDDDRIIREMRVIICDDDIYNLDYN